MRSLGRHSSTPQAVLQVSLLRGWARTVSHSNSDPSTAKMTSGGASLRRLCRWLPTPPNRVAWMQLIRGFVESGMGSRDRTVEVMLLAQRPYVQQRVARPVKSSSVAMVGRTRVDEEIGNILSATLAAPLRAAPGRERTSLDSEGAEPNSTGIARERRKTAPDLRFRRSGAVSVGGRYWV